jgi:monothiol glutaredoxin
MSHAAAASDVDTQARIAEIVKAHPVVLFMKGTPAFPMCGFSAATVAVLQAHRVPFHSVDVLADPAVRQGIKFYSDWPTIPQLYVNGTFVGGCDIVREMHDSGELPALFATVGADAS